MEHEYTKTAWRVQHKGRGKPVHWQGGPARHKGATCPICKTALMLLWDLDCSRLRKKEKGKFGKLKRLPLYYCWTCCADGLRYSLEPADTKVRVLRNRGTPQGPGFPYEGFPAHFERVPIWLEPIPFEIYRLNLFAIKAGLEWLTREERAHLARWVGIKPKDFNYYGGQHQVGGAFWLCQGNPEATCSRGKCGYRTMKEIAVVYDDPLHGLPMTTPASESEADDFSSVQVVFNLCDNCFTVDVSHSCT